MRGSFRLGIPGFLWIRMLRAFSTFGMISIFLVISAFVVMSIFVILVIYLFSTVKNPPSYVVYDVLDYMFFFIILLGLIYLSMERYMNFIMEWIRLNFSWLNFGCLYILQFSLMIVGVYEIFWLCQLLIVLFNQQTIMALVIIYASGCLWIKC
jgi:hypothetical protein